MNPTTLVLVSGMFALIVGALILFALMSGIVVPALGSADLCVRRKDSPRLYWLNLMGLAYTLVGCIVALMRNWSGATLPPLY
jgi:hypothetical protein